jgi:hypothetical protein
VPGRLSSKVQRNHPPLKILVGPANEHQGKRPSTLNAGESGAVFDSSFRTLPSLIVTTMPRSATDATRFTSTTPHATAKVPPPSARSWAVPRAKPGPSGETPQEKVRRLRAAADAAKLDQISTFDKVIARGRVWADRAHRFTSLTLISATCMKYPLYNPLSDGMSSYEQLLT